jgi:hypothetical protein
MRANTNSQRQQDPPSHPGSLKWNAAVFRVLAVMVAAALACNFPLPTPGPALPGEAPAMPTGAPQPPPPMTLLDLYEGNVASGAWTEGQGLVQMFGYFTGEIPAADVMGGREVMPDNIDMLMAIAQNYVAAHPDAPESAEIQRRMNLLIPDADRLLPYSEEIKDLSRTGGNKLARPRSEPNSDEVECNQIWANGFPTPASGGAHICFDLLKFTASGVPFRIFIERNWLGQDAQTRMSRITLAKEGLSDAAATYLEYANNGLLRTDVIFNQLTDRDPATNQERPKVLMATLPTMGQVCRIGIFPRSFSLVDDFFRQDVAHEMFHCFQGNNLVDTAGANISAIAWWLEGTAEYWSNVVYPDVNEEHTRTKSLDDLIRTTPLFLIRYPNFLFFQYMANKFGNRPELAVLSWLPPDGDETAFATELNARLPDPADFYHSFGEGYLDGSIPDTGSVNAPVHAGEGIPVRMDQVNSYEAVAHPYQPNWIHLIFPKSLKYVVSVSEDGSGRHSVRPDGNTGIWWQQLPSEVDTSCGGLDYTVLLTNVQPASDYYFKVTVQDRKPKPACETPVPVAGDCLLGRWELMTDSYPAYAQSIVSQTTARLDSATIQGATFDFDGKTGICTQTIVDEAVTLTQKGGGTIDPQTDVFTPDVQIVVGVSGTVTPSFEHTVDAKTGVGTILYRPGEGSLLIRVAINGVESPATTMDARELNYMSSERATYVCSGDTLIYTPDRGAAVAPLRFRRVSAAPSP